MHTLEFAVVIRVAYHYEMVKTARRRKNGQHKVKNVKVYHGSKSTYPKAVVGGGKGASPNKKAKTRAVGASSNKKVEAKVVDGGREGAAPRGRPKV